MKIAIAVGVLAMSCVTGMSEQRRYNPDGSPAPLASEMAAGAEICGQMCASWHRPMLRYQTDGKCICDQDQRVAIPREERQSIPKYLPDNKT
jgi:hypothetical protein